MIEDIHVNSTRNNSIITNLIISLTTHSRHETFAATNACYAINGVIARGSGFYINKISMVPQKGKGGLRVKAVNFLIAQSCNASSPSRMHFNDDNGTPALDKSPVLKSLNFKNGLGILVTRS